MENREILVANTKTQTRVKVTTNATTLGELKAAFDAQGIDYSGMTFTEGITKTQLLDDSSPLPKDVMYKGQPTNSLVILLTNTKKNIASGAGDRKVAYEIIKDRQLQDAVKETFGKNFTQVTTDQLWEFIHDNEVEDEEDESEDSEQGTAEDDLPSWGSDYDVDVERSAPVFCYCEEWYAFLKQLVEDKHISYEELFDLAEMVEELANMTKELTTGTIQVGDTVISESDIDDMMASL